LPPHFITGEGLLDLQMNSFYLAGMSNSNIYLGNKTAPAFLFITNYKLTDTIHKILNFPKNLDIYPEGIQTFIDSPYIYCMEGITPIVHQGELSDQTMIKLPDQNLNFNASLPISSSSFVIRSFDTLSKQNILIKTNPNTNSIIRAPKILEKQVDGIFCTDGMLCFDPIGKKIFYVYYYRNQFLCLDTNLNLLYKGKTIDTVTKAHINIARIASQNKTTIVGQPLIVNKTSCVDGSYLFVNSNLKADNEDKNPPVRHSVIDVYSLENGKYQYSFYVPYDNQAVMESFGVKNGFLVALFDHSLISFELHFPHSN
jgi:hypothetical protein